MKEFNLLKSYPNKSLRKVSNNFRTIKNRIIATYKDKRFYDGSRNNGYGGYINDGRWNKVAQNIFNHYKLKYNSKILHIGCDKGYLIESIKELYPKSIVYGVENSRYPIGCSSKKIKKLIKFSDYYNLPFKKNFFDFVIAIGPVYSLNLRDSIKCLKEIKRVGKGKSFITLGAYENFKDLTYFMKWTLLGATVLKKQEWKQVLKHTKYTGDYKFNTTKSLNLFKNK